jgi:sugar (pentulose or hexulose) kinase
MLNIPLICFTDAQATALGSFISASKTLGIYSTYQEAFKAARSNDTVTRYQPDPEVHQQYRKIIGVSEWVYQKLNRFEL